jgi:uncharacterized repeat protein (TIGR03806 family)
VIPELRVPPAARVLSTCWLGAIALAIGACGGSSAGPKDAGGGAGTTGAAGTGGVGATGGGGVAGNGAAGTEGGAGGQAGAAYGLDQRPTNTTCLAPATEADMPTTLSATGCVDATDPTKPAAGLIPYDVRSPLWSDGADKRRWMALPDGGKIHVGADGDWDFPNGTVLVKSFLLGGKLVETRLFARLRGGDGGAAAGTWRGFSFYWSADQTDAQLLQGNGTQDYDVGGTTQTWFFPSRDECNKCHAAVAGYTLGLETAQLNSAFSYPGGRVANQLDTLDHIGAFDAALAARPSDLPALAVPSGTEPVEARARSYLHANCSMCHRPGTDSTFGAAIDLRFATTFKATGLCNVAPAKGDVGVAGALLLTPGDPGKSVVVLRPTSTSTTWRMPPLASSVVHGDGIALLTSWISGLTACP